jgi:aminoglycoside 6-adenylyltransferase
MAVLAHLSHHAGHPGILAIEALISILVRFRMARERGNPPNSLATGQWTYVRSEQEMLDLILHVARDDERVRAVLLNGSRADPNAERDIFQDFDVVYLVSEVGSIRRERTWVDRFGGRLIMQTPEDMQTPPPVNDGRFSYLMLLADGNRIDLTLFPVAGFDLLPRDSLSVLLLDKDDVVGFLPEPSDRDYLPRPPDEKAFSDSCNEFWWVSTYVAKGLWREEVVYAKRMLDQILREELMRMLDWHIGFKTDFSRGSGSYGRHLEKELEPELWSLVRQTYADGSCEATWRSLGVMCDLFRRVAKAIAGRCGFAYPEKEDQRVSAYLDHVHALPKQAQDIY